MTRCVHNLLFVDSVFIVFSFCMFFPSLIWNEYPYFYLRCVAQLASSHLQLVKPIGSALTESVTLWSSLCRTMQRSQVSKSYTFPTGAWILLDIWWYMSRFFPGGSEIISICRVQNGCCNNSQLVASKVGHVPASICLMMCYLDDRNVSIFTKAADTWNPWNPESRSHIFFMLSSLLLNYAYS